MKNVLAGAALLLYILSPGLWSRLTPNEYAGGRSRNIADQQARNNSAIASMLGEFRTGISDIMMIKTERYMHSGVAYEDSHIGEVVKQDMQQEQALDGDHSDHDHAEKPVVGSRSRALIAAPDQDFRSFIGHLHRAVKPYMPPNEHAAHTDGTQLLPWYRIATLSDPHHIRSYTIGGYWLSRSNEDAAERFLLEGLEKNPQAFSLQLMLGQMYMKRARLASHDLFNPSVVERPLFEKAHDRFKAAAASALSQRPHGQLDASPFWDENAEGDAWSAFRMDVLMEQKYGSEAQALALAEKYLQVAGPDPILQRIVDDRPELPGQGLFPGLETEDHSGHVHGPHCDH